MNFSPDSKFMYYCGKFVALVKVNLLWLLCSLPVFTIGASTCAMLSTLTAMKEEEDCGDGIAIGFQASQDLEEYEEDEDE